MEELKLQVKLEEADIYNFQKKLYFQSIPPVLYYIVTISILIISIALTVNSLIKKNPNGSNFIILFCIMLFLIILPLRIKKTAKKVLSTNKLFVYPLNYEISEEGFSITSEVSNSFIKWTNFYKTLETKEYYYLFIASRQAYVIPKKYINGDEAANFIKKCLNNVVVSPEEQQKKKKIYKWIIFYVLLFVIITLVLALYR